MQHCKKRGTYHHDNDEIRTGSFVHIHDKFATYQTSMVATLGLDTVVDTSLVELRFSAPLPSL